MLQICQIIPKYKYGKTTVLPIQNPKRAGYKFLGWSYNKNATKPDIQPGQSTSFNWIGNSSIELYAVWENVYYTLRFDKNTEDSVKNMPNEKQIIIGNSNILPANVPERNGYKFLGWAKSSYAVSEQFRPGDYFLHDTYDDVTLYAVWKKKTAVSIKIEAVDVKTEGGSMEGIELCVQDENNVWVPPGTSNGGNSQNYYATNLYLKVIVEPADAGINIDWTSSNNYLGQVANGKVSFNYNAENRALGGKFDIIATDKNSGVSDSITVYAYNAQRKSDEAYVWNKPHGEYIDNGHSMVRVGDKLIFKTENSNIYEDGVGEYTWHKICYYYTTHTTDPVQEGYVMVYTHNRNKKYYTYGVYDWTP